MPVAIIMGMATLNSTEKRLFSRDLKRAIVEVLPFYETNELALSNILKKVLFSMGKKFGQVTTTVRSLLVGRNLFRPPIATGRLESST